MKCSFLQAAIVSILPHGCSTWTLTKRLEKKLDGNYTRMLRAILNKYWRHHPHKAPTTVTCLLSRKLSKLDELDMQETAGEVGTSSKVMYSYGPPHMAEQKQDDQLEHTYSSYVRIRDVPLKTYQRQWKIGKSGERGSWISVLAERHDDDDDVPHAAVWNCLLFQAGPTHISTLRCQRPYLFWPINRPSLSRGNVYWVLI